jgi:hypothetical protein
MFPMPFDAVTQRAACKDWKISTLMQLTTIEAAADRVTAVVVEPALRAPRGLAGLAAACDKLIDYLAKPHALQQRQVGRFSPFENFMHICGCLPEQVRRFAP